jgi:hypothetical protein
MPDAPSLRELERTLFALIRAPDGVGPAMRARRLSKRRLAEIIAGDDRLDATGRVEIYADMYFLRLQDVLREAFPKLRAVLGDDAFGALCSDYLHTHPSRHPSLRQLGDRLAAFLAGPADRRPRCPAPPAWAADLAALEWARYDVFDAADAPLLAMPDLAALPPEAFATLLIQLAPGHHLVRLQHPVHTVWRAISKQQPVPEAGPSATTLLVWRQENFVYHRPLDAREAGLLARAAGGIEFGAVCETIADAPAPGDAPEDPAHAAFQLLARWVGDGLLVRRA